MKIYIIAGEASGDLHGSNLIKALNQQAPSAACRVWGGDLMRAAGGELVKHYRDLAFMGFVEVIKNLRTIWRNLAFCKQDILDYKPDVLVLIDYPGFNLRIAKWAHKEGIKVVYYISPQIWAWHRSRVYDIKRDVDKMLVILPFETDFYRQYEVEAIFVGHPLLDALAPTALPPIPKPLQTPNAKIVALLPGSRKQEVQRMLPIMLSITPFFPDCHFVVAGADALPASYYSAFMTAFPNVSLVQGQTYDVLRQATAALVKSGTSTLETALLGVPQVVCYAGNPLSYAIAKRLVKVKYISLVNLIADQLLVKELIQNELNSDNLRLALSDVLVPVHAAAIQDGYRMLREKLGNQGASERAASIILQA